MRQCNEATRSPLTDALSAARPAQAHATSAQAKDFSRFQEQLQLETASILAQHTKAKPV